MHGGGAKRVSFFKKNSNRVKFEICFEFGLKIKKNRWGWFALPFLFFFF